MLLHALILLQPGVGNDVVADVRSRSLVAMLRPTFSSPPVVHDASRHAAVHTPSLQPVPNVLPRVEATAREAEGVQAATENAAINSTGIAAANTAGADRQSASDAGFSEGKKSYLFAIAAEARRVRKYPPRAFAAGWQGTAEVQINVAIGGMALPPRLYKSSGYPDMDEAALAFVSIAQQRTAVPENLRNRAFDVLVPVSFTIDSR